MVIWANKSDEFRKILYGFIGTSLAMSIVFYCFHQIVFSAAFFLFIFAIIIENQFIMRHDTKMMMDKIEDLTHTNELWGEIVFEESALKVIPYGNTESEYSMEYSRFKDFYILKHYCVFGDKRKIEKGLTQETIIIDKTVLTEADMHSFYRIPKLLFTNDYFKALSNDAKILYGLMLDRMSLSMKNQMV